MYNAQKTADIIKNILSEKKITAKQMCQDCNLGINALSNIRNGNIKNIEVFETLSEYFNCSIDYLLGRVLFISEMTNLSDDISEQMLCQFPREIIGEFISEKNIIQPPSKLKGTKNYFVRAVNYNKIIEIYDKAAEFNSDKIIDKDAYEDLFEYYKSYITELTNFGRGYELSKENYEEFKKVYDLYIRSFAEKIFISFRK